MKLRLLAIAPALMLSSCGLQSVASAGSAVAGVVEAVTSNAGRVEIAGLQGLIIANEFYQPLNRAALAALPFLNKQQVLAVREANRKATAALVAGNKATNEVERAAAAAEVFKQALALRGVVPAKG
jgi:hypothetical protein